MNKDSIEIPQEVLDSLAVLNSPADRTNLARNNEVRLQAGEKLFGWKYEHGISAEVQRERISFVKESLGVTSEECSAPPIDVVVEPIYGDTVKARKRDQAIYNKGERINW